MKMATRKGILFGLSIAVTLLASAIFITTTIRALWYAPEVEVPIAADIQEAAAGDVPSRLRIPALGIDAHVQQVGINASGNMATPNNFTDVGWYKYGPPPGFQGSAVLAGHVDNGLGLSGVFKKLNELSVGDEIQVENKNGERMDFRVVEIQTYPHDKVPNHILFARDDAARLNLITCEGDWLQSERTYDKRLVVYAELVR